jgi:hypothetical protein
MLNSKHACVTVDHMLRDWNADDIMDTTGNFLHHHVEKIDKLIKEQNKLFIIVGMKQHYNSSMMTLK